MKPNRLVLTIVALFAGWLAGAGVAFGSEPVLRVVKPRAPGQTLLQNGDFERVLDGRLAGWQAAPKGFQVAGGAGRGGSQALLCANPTVQGWWGASQTLTLNRTRVAPLTVRGWSKAENVSGGADSGYSLYVDITYTDGTPLWGQAAEFRCGSHDWEPREFVILPDKPVRTVTLHCLFRGHSGKAWFDDVTVEEIKAEGGAVLYQGVPVLPAQAPRAGEGRRTSYATRDGLRLALRDNTVSSLRVGQRELGTAAPSGFLARDVAANSDVFGFSGGVCAELGLRLETRLIAKLDHLVVEGRLLDTTGQDRAVTLVFALPLDAIGWRWGDDVRRYRVIEGNGEYANQVTVRGGATGAMALYPMAAVYDDRVGLALALDMAQPAQYRLGYHAGTRQLFIAYDFGLAKETEPWPGSAGFRFVLYRFEPRWGFRAAWQKFMQAFPDYFVVRAKDQGLWMPFTDVGTVQDWQDFGFKFHEGNNNVAFDDTAGILSFRYTEPMTWWMPMPKEAPRTPGEALRVRDQMAQGPNETRRRLAEVTRSAAMFDAAGQAALLFRNEPWCDGAVWSLNPNPHLPGALNAATLHWNESLKQRLYGPAAKGQLDGEYLDSLEGYVTADLNFRREHFRYSRVPLTFASDTKQPALSKGLAVFEFTQWFCAEVHQLGKLTFANGVPYRFTFLCPWLDVMGTETDWVRAGKYQPASDSQMNLWRTLCGAKPYLLLMNTDYDTFGAEMVEKYFRRSLFYGMFPGMFSHNAAENPYWQNPKWYNRDRPLFKKYLPLIKRVAEAGWQPVTEATCDNSDLRLERFGPDAAGVVYFTVFNDTDRLQGGTLSLNTAALRLKKPLRAFELVSGSVPERTSGGWRVALAPQEVAVLGFLR